MASKVQLKLNCMVFFLLERTDLLCKLHIMSAPMGVGGGGESGFIYIDREILDMEQHN